MAKFDKIIKGGTIVDGARSPRFVADVGIKNGIIAEIGELNAKDAAEVLDAEGLIVAPGYIDLHTHYDAQINWDPYLTMASWHGVTSLVIGNCGFGFAPCRPEDQDQYMLSMSRVEAIPYESMKEGMKWGWETFPDWLDTLDKLPKGINIISYVPVGPLMIYVMGYKAAKSRHATKEELAEMCRLLEESLDAGGCGWSAQRLGDSFMSVQRDYDGTPMVTDMMTDDECMAFADVLRRRGEGHIQLTQAKENINEDLVFCAKLAEFAGVPMLYNAIVVNDDQPHQHRRIIKWVEDCQSKNIPMWGVCVVAENEQRFTLEDFNLLDGNEAWRDVTIGSVQERMAKMTEPRHLEALRQDYDHGRTPFVCGPVSRYVIDETFKPENKKYEGKTVAEIGKMEGRHPIDVLIELCVSEDLRTVIYTPPFNVNPELNADLFKSEYTIPGVSDGGAHMKYITIGRYPTEFISTFVRKHGHITLEEAHYRLSGLPAQCAGFKDRGELREGLAADIVVYDYDKLAVTPETPVILHDVPAGEWRRVQYAEGNRWILINGEVTFKDGDCTGALPGQLLRHGSADGARQRKAG